MKEVTLCVLPKFDEDSFTTDEVRDQTAREFETANQPFSPKPTQSAVTFDLAITRSTADTAMIFTDHNLDLPNYFVSKFDGLNDRGC